MPSRLINWSNVMKIIKSFALFSIIFTIFSLAGRVLIIDKKIDVDFLCYHILTILIVFIFTLLSLAIFKIVKFGDIDDRK